jgi:acylphosphatase
MKRLTAIASGRVQRGFRIRTWKDALLIGLHGYVKNLPDGSVQVVVEGKEADLERFAEALAVNKRNINVSSIEKRYSPATGEFKTFEILWDEKDAELYEVAEVLIEAFDSRAQNPD